MVQQCYLCKVYRHQAGEKYITFHSLPRDPERRNIWISVLGFNKDHQFPKRVEICSRHFLESDFVCETEEQRILKRDAVPISSHSLFDPSTSISSESSVNPEKQEQLQLCLPSSSIQYHLSYKVSEDSGDILHDGSTIFIVSSSDEENPPKKCSKLSVSPVKQKQLQLYLPSGSIKYHQSYKVNEDSDGILDDGSIVFIGSSSDEENHPEKWQYAKPPGMETSPKQVQAL